MGKAAAVPGTDNIGRWGVMYVRSILAQAGIIHGEVSGGEDHLAVDMTLTFPVGTVTMQVKTGTRNPNKDASITVPTTKAWRTKWEEAKTPVYLVYVRLEKAPPMEWIDHADLHTTLHARAHWLRVNELSVSSVRLPVANRLTAETFDVWVDDFNKAFGKAASA